jgi:hypothetical protein
MSKRARFRFGACYAFDVYHPVTGKEVCGYVGKTRRKPSVRETEHLKGRPGVPPKPWADTVIRFRVIYSSQRVSTFGLWWREIRYILKLKPLYNIQYRSRKNIPPWMALEQRRDRDCSIMSTRYRRQVIPEMGIRKLSDGSWESYGQVHAWTGEP